MYVYLIVVLGSVLYSVLLKIGSKDSYTISLFFKHPNLQYVIQIIDDNDINNLNVDVNGTSKQLCVYGRRLWCLYTKL